MTTYSYELSFRVYISKKWFTSLLKTEVQNIRLFTTCSKEVDRVRTVRFSNHTGWYLKFKSALRLSKQINQLPSEDLSELSLEDIIYQSEIVLKLQIYHFWGFMLISRIKLRPLKNQLIPVLNRSKKPGVTVWRNRELSTEPQRKPGVMDSSPPVVS